MTARSVTLTCEQLSAWAGRELSVDEIDQIAMAIPHSSIPDAISTIALLRRVLDLDAGAQLDLFDHLH